MKWNKYTTFGYLKCWWLFVFILVVVVSQTLLEFQFRHQASEKWKISCSSWPDGKFQDTMCETIAADGEAPDLVYRDMEVQSWLFMASQEKGWIGFVFFLFLLP